MDYFYGRFEQWEPFTFNGARCRGGNNMEKLEKRIERVEQDLHQVKIDIAVLTERSQTFATKADLEVIRSEHGAFKKEVIQRFDNIDKRFDAIDKKFDTIDKKFDAIDKKFDALNNRIIWTMMVPLTLFVVGWFIKTAVLHV
ncbi:hypothetical protein ACF2G4_07280 [Pantoea sp. C3]|uniref:hypothetical protein n=1 Tax=Pantoea phytostimulans TaxID=2769024 RepID=UPI0038F7F5B7